MTIHSKKDYSLDQIRRHLETDPIVPGQKFPRVRDHIPTIELVDEVSGAPCDRHVP